MAATSTSAFVWVLTGLVAGTCAMPAYAQDPQEPAFAVTTTAIVLDVVVRGRGHQPVTDLSADDFEVFEDGRRQVITGFQHVSDASGSSTISSFGFG